jgi:CheY-like chemotaxis protein
MDVSVLDFQNRFPGGSGQESLRDCMGASDATARKCGILLVDNDACLRNILSIGLRQEGFALWVAADGLEAIDTYGRHCEAIDVVLMDVRMPGIDGPQTLVALQTVNSEIRCCFMSGDFGGYTAEELLMLGAVALIRKPFQLADVARLVCEQAGKIVETCSSA